MMSISSLSLLMLAAENSIFKKLENGLTKYHLIGYNIGRSDKMQESLLCCRSLQKLGKYGGNYNDFCRPQKKLLFNPEKGDVMQK